MEYKEFRVFIDDENHIRIIKPSGLSRTGKVQMDRLKERTINIFNRWLAEGNITRREELVVLGTCLYNILFDDKISEEFKDDFDKVQKQQSTGLRLVLEFEQKARKLAEMPWEYIYYPDSDREKGFFIATRSRLVLARQVPLNVEALKPTEKPLRVLIVVSQPEGLGTVLFNWDEIPGDDNGRIIEFMRQNFHVNWVSVGKIDKIDDGKTITISYEKNSLSLKLNDEKSKATKAILIIDDRKTDEFVVKRENGKLNIYGIVNADMVIKTLEELKNRVPDTIQIELLPQPTKRSLPERINAFRPHVMHFIGHGKGESLALVKEGDMKTPYWISDTDLADFFLDYQPHLIFLQACEVDHSESYEAFRGLALQLVYSKVQAVVAMRYPIENSVANRFASTFYQALGKGEPIDVAVQSGRSDLAMYLNEEQNFSSRAFGSPVVYLQSADGIIIAKKMDEEGPSLVPPSFTKSPCPYPDCSGSIVSDDVICVKCKGHLMPCPKCHKVMPKDIGICPKCQYDINKEPSVEPPKMKSKPKGLIG